MFRVIIVAEQQLNVSKNSFCHFCILSVSSRFLTSSLVLCLIFSLSFDHFVYFNQYITAAAAICKPLGWKQRPGRPYHTWLRAIELYLRLLHIGPLYAWKKETSREHWHLIVDTAMLMQRKP